MLTIPQRGGTLSLYGRDSKIHLTDYPVGDYKLLYTTAEVFTWKKYASRTVLILYAGLNELHEFAVDTPSQQEAKVMRIDGSSILLHEESSSTIVQWKPGPKRQFIQVGDLAIYLLGIVSLSLLSLLFFLLCPTKRSNCVFLKEPFD